MLGDANVGKTSLLARFVQGKWRPGYRATLGVDFFTKEMSVMTGNTEQVVTLQLWYGETHPATSVTDVCVATGTPQAWSAA